MLMMFGGFATLLANVSFTPVVDLIFLCLYLWSITRMSHLISSLSGDVRGNVPACAIFLLILIGAIAHTISSWITVLTVLVGISTLIVRQKFWISCSLVAFFSIVVGIAMGFVELSVSQQ